jgi:hypothetical protein
LTGYPLHGRSSRGRASLLDIRSPGLLSRRVSTVFSGGWTADRGLPLSDQPPACASRNPRRTLLYLQGASRVPDAASARRIRVNRWRNRDLSVDSKLWNRRRSDTTAAGCTVSAHNRGALPILGRHPSQVAPSQVRTLPAGREVSGLQPRRDSFWRSSRSVRNPEVSRMRPRI